MVKYFSPENAEIKIAQNYTEFASNNSTTATDNTTNFYSGGRWSFNSRVCARFR